MDTATIKQRIASIASNIFNGLEDPLGRGLPELKDVARELAGLAAKIPDPEPGITAIVVWGETPDDIAVKIAEGYQDGFIVVALSGRGNEYMAVMERRG